jgi:hypothetical protein
VVTPGVQEQVHQAGLDTTDELVVKLTGDGFQYFGRTYTQIVMSYLNKSLQQIAQMPKWYISM